MSRRFRPSNRLRIGYPGRSFPNHYVPASNGGFAKGSPQRSPSENGRIETVQFVVARVRDCGRSRNDRPHTALLQAIRLCNKGANHGNHYCTCRPEAVE
jgi:hypothetical protein